jgi:mono/diheme cytochrome c family protein/plastocyanin
MKRPELISRVLIMAGVFLAVGEPLFFSARTPLIHARMAETGGWSPDIIQAEAGEPLHLQFTSDDVVHGFAVGQMDAQGAEAVTIEPGKVTDVTLTFDKPGVYTFFCTRWCGVNHWRMRGTIEVNGPDPIAETAPEIPLYVTLGIDIDAPHESPVIPDTRPSAARGEKLAASLDMSEFIEPGFYSMSSPYQIFEALAETSLSDAERWDVVSYIWQSNTMPESLTNGRELYAQNCAACHGETGGGDGVFADDLAAAGEASMTSMGGSMNMAMQAPADLSDAGHILGASPALLEGKILRGGMGTGMPMWGSILTQEQIWDVVAYLYSFQFEYEKEVQ